MVRVNRRPPSQHPSLLLVCPSHSGLHRAANAIREEGFAVRHVGSTYGALVEQHRSPAEIVVVDTTSLLDHELEVFAALRAIWPQSFLLASLPAAARHKASQALARGADAYLLEPFEAREVRLLLDRSVERRRAEPAGPRGTDGLAVLGRLAAGVAHEINNPLTTISGWLQIALEEAEPASKAHKTFLTMHEEVERIAAVVANLLQFAGIPPVDEEVVDVNGLLADIVGGLDRGEVSITTDLADDLPWIVANRQQLRTACQQVILNALKRLEGRGELKVATRSVDHDDQIAIEIADGGRGMAERTVPSAFEPFFEGGGGRAGLGLSAAYGIINGHGGTIEVLSREHEASRFLIRLPLHRLRHRNRVLDYVT